MKKEFLIILLVLSSISIAFAQIPEPDFNNKPFYLEDNTLKRFETVNATIDIKLKGMGYGGADYYYTVFSKTSTTKFKGGEMPIFVIKVEDGVDPEDFLTLVKAKVKRKKRLFIQGSRTMTGSTRDKSEYFVPIAYEKISKDYYKIIIEQDLEIGEYSIIRKMNTEKQAGVQVKIYCFSVN